jgi:septal ring factor EnvC (AmiA/AmiB activator)
MLRFAVLIFSALIFVNFTIAQQQPPPKNYSKSELHSLNTNYVDLQKELSAAQKDRQQVENTLKAYNLKLKALAESMQKTEEQIDFASGTYSYDPNFSSTTQQIKAMEMSFNLKSIDLMSEIQRQQGEIVRAGQVVDAKYENMKKTKSADR